MPRSAISTVMNARTIKLRGVMDIGFMLTSLSCSIYALNVTQFQKKIQLLSIIENGHCHVGTPIVS